MHTTEQLRRVQQEARDVAAKHRKTVVLVQAVAVLSAHARARLLSARCHLAQARLALSGARS